MPCLVLTQPSLRAISHRGSAERCQRARLPGNGGRPTIADVERTTLPRPRAKLCVPDQCNSLGKHAQCAPVPGRNGSDPIGSRPVEREARKRDRQALFFVPWTGTATTKLGRIGRGESRKRRRDTGHPLHPDVVVKHRELARNAKRFAPGQSTNNRLAGRLKSRALLEGICRASPSAEERSGPRLAFFRLEPEVQ